MNDKTIWSQKFRQLLMDIMLEHRDRANVLSLNGDTSAAVLENIRYNIAELYLKLFEVSSQEVIPPFNKQIRDIIREFPEPDDRSDRIFRYYLEFVSRSWETGLEMARQHDDPETIMKETVKLEIRDAIRTAFESLRSESGRMYS